MRHRRPKANEIPFAWYWEGKPLRGNEIQPVYTGAYQYQCQYPCCSPYQHERPVDANPLSSNSSRAKKDPEESHHYSHDPYCSPAGSGSGSGSRSKPGTASETEIGSGYECNCSTCRMPDGGISSCCAASNPSSIHYHAHAYFCCNPMNYPQPPSPGACSCSWCQGYYRTQEDRHPCPDCLPLSPRPRYNPPSSTDACDGQQSYPNYPGDDDNGYQRKTARSRTRTRARARARARAGAGAHDEVSENDSTDSVVSSGCCSECDGEVDGRASRYPAYRGKKR